MREFLLDLNFLHGELIGPQGLNFWDDLLIQVLLDGFFGLHFCWQAVEKSDFFIDLFPQKSV